MGNVKILKPKLKQPRKRKGHRVSVRFDRYPGLLDALVLEADTECRSLNDQIVYFCKEGLKFNQEVNQWENES